VGPNRNRQADPKLSESERAKVDDRVKKGLYKDFIAQVAPSSRAQAEDSSQSQQSIGRRVDSVRGTSVDLDAVVGGLQNSFRDIKRETTPQDPSDTVDGPSRHLVRPGARSRRGMDHQIRRLGPGGGAGSSSSEVSDP